MSKPWALYNEIDEFAATWLEKLIARGVIAPGYVDRRSIVDIRPYDLRGFRQVHLFAGIGVWSYSFRCAGISDDTEAWSASCPCQPFSSAGEGAGMDDERHLWPHAHHLVRECRPALIVGEQVASKDGLAWGDLVQTDMEGTNYAFGRVDTCSAGFGAPHIRQRQYWFGKRLADSEGNGFYSRTRPDAARPQFDGLGFGDCEQFGKLDFTPGCGREGFGHQSEYRQPLQTEPTFIGLADDDDDGFCQSAITSVHDASYHSEPCGSAGWLDNLLGDGRRERRIGHNGRDDRQQSHTDESNGWTGPTNGFWGDVDWLHCRDAKWRPVEPGTFPLAHGAPARVGRLRGYGNAINAAQATGFLEAFLESQAIDIEANAVPSSHGSSFEDLI